MTRIFFSKKEKAAALLLLLSNLLICLMLWMDHTYDRVRFDQILFLLKSSSTGVHGALSASAAFYVGVISVWVTALQAVLYFFLSGKCTSKLPRFQTLHKHALSVASAIFFITLAVFSIRMEIIPYLKADATDSTFIQTHYVKPDNSILRFPEQKRNLIYIILESMECTYADPAAGESITACYIPELKSLAENNVNFSHTSGFGGALSFPGTTWTAAAMVAQTSGVVIKVSLKADTYGAGDVFLPGVTSIGQFLDEMGYSQVLLLGSNAEFHGREIYFTEHGNYSILDTDALKASGRLPEDYNEWWGFEDEKLFSYAKEEVTRLAAAGEPFNFTMLTADTHFPDGCHCDLCEELYEEPYANVLACSSRQVNDFIEWIKEQPFYENTTIVISGDHLTMDAGFMDQVNPNYTRTIYNCFINSAAKPVKEKKRQFGTFDLYPTTLAALGVEIKGGRLALGTNLFSDKATLTEQFGYAYLVGELQKQSDFYDKELLLFEN